MDPTSPQEPLQDDHDSPWKEALEHYFPEFLSLLFPDLAVEVDWRRGFEFLDKELQQVVRDAELGRRHADKLVKVYARDGTETWLLIHVEVQGQAETGFAERMYVYNYRLYDRYKAEVLSLAVLTDMASGFRPEEYRRERAGFQLLFRFPVCKLLDWSLRWVELEASDNRFAQVVMAHLKANASRDGEERKRWKLYLILRMYERGYERQDILELFRVIDWIITLPAGLDERFRQELYAFEEDRKMPYITSIERMGIEKGIRQGIQQGIEQGIEQGAAQVLERLLVRRFGELPAWARERLQAASRQELDDWTDRVLTAGGLDEVFQQPS